MRSPYVALAAIPDIDGEPPRMVLLLAEPGTHRLFVNTMRRPLYSISYDGKAVTHAGFRASPSTPNLTSAARADTANSTPIPPTPRRRPTSSPMVRATPTTRFYWNGPRKIRKPPPTMARRRAKSSEPPSRFRSTTGDSLPSIRPRPGTPDYGLNYVGVADRGNGGDPYKHAQNLFYAFGTLLRIDPLGEKITPVKAGANLGWNIWEGSFTYGPGEVGTANPRGDRCLRLPRHRHKRAHQQTDLRRQAQRRALLPRRRQLAQRGDKTPPAVSLIRR